MASGAQTQPACGMPTSQLSGPSQSVMLSDCHIIRLLLPAYCAASQPFPASIRRSVAMITYFPFSGLRRMKGSLTPFSPIPDTSTGSPWFRSSQCIPSLLTEK